MSTGPITDVEAINQFKNKICAETDGIIQVLSIDDIEYTRHNVMDIKRLLKLI